MASFTVNRLDHIAVDVADVDRSRAFYAGVLGIREIARPKSFDFPGAWFDTGNGVIHIVAREKPDVPRKPHMCLWVSDLESAARAVAEAGFQVRYDGRGTIPGVVRFYTDDPDGNRIEIQGTASKT
jgi:glyoxylase I family protein